jgi:hypothetical protein
LRFKRIPHIDVKRKKNEIQFFKCFTFILHDALFLAEEHR